MLKIFLSLFEVKLYWLCYVEINYIQSNHINTAILKKTDSDSEPIPSTRSCTVSEIVSDSMPIGCSKVVWMCILVHRCLSFCLKCRRISHHLPG